MAETVDGRARDMAATAQSATFFVAQALAVIIPKLDNLAPLTPDEIEKLHFALTPLDGHANATRNETALGILEMLRSALPPKARP